MRARRKEQTIHLRFRYETNHFMLYGYTRVVDIMAHELAHCAHQNHGAGFYDVMADIKREYVCLMSGTRHQDSHGPYNEYGDFNPYASLSGTR
jgi:hypothetical protein